MTRADDNRCYGIYPENEQIWNLDVKTGLSVQVSVGWSDQVEGWAAIAVLTSDHGGKVEELTYLLVPKERGFLNTSLKHATEVVLPPLHVRL